MGLFTNTITNGVRVGWHRVCSSAPLRSGQVRRRADGVCRSGGLSRSDPGIGVGDGGAPPCQRSYKLFGVVTNRALAGEAMIWSSRERCGKSEEAPAAMEDDRAGGILPSGLFGTNAAWWAIMVLTDDLNAAMKRLVLGPDWVAKRMKALRFHLIALPGRVMRRSRRLIIRLAGGDGWLGRSTAVRLTWRSNAATSTFVSRTTVGPASRGRERIATGAHRPRDHAPESQDRGVVRELWSLGGV